MGTAVNCGGYADADMPPGGWPIGSPQAGGLGGQIGWTHTGGHRKANWPVKTPRAAGSGGAWQVLGVGRKGHMARRLLRPSGGHFKEGLRCHDGCRCEGDVGRFGNQAGRHPAMADRD
jgi:hypothetical protein